MPYVHAHSLSQTIDALNAAFFEQWPIPERQAAAAAAFIAARFAGPRAYAGTFALFPDEAAAGIRLFTGERATNASARHIAAQEACRVLRLLKPAADAKSALRAAAQSLANCVGPAAPAVRPTDEGHQHWCRLYRGGAYCCGPCTVGFWRHLLAGGYDEPETRLARGLAALKTMRKSDHSWRSFPFWYTLSALIEMPLTPAVKVELQFAAPRCRRAAAKTTSDLFPARRAEIARRALARV